MLIQKGQQNLSKLPFNRGGFYHIPLSAEVIKALPDGPKTRIICELDKRLSIRCGLNPLGAGAYFILLAKRYIEQLEMTEGDLISYTLTVDPDPLGVDIPEVMHELFDQDPEARSIFEQLRNPRKRTLIHRTNRVKNIDLQVRHILDFLEEEAHKIRQRNIR